MHTKDLFLGSIVLRCLLWSRIVGVHELLKNEASDFLRGENFSSFLPSQRPSFTPVIHFFLCKQQEKNPVSSDRGRSEPDRQESRDFHFLWTSRRLSAQLSVSHLSGLIDFCLLPWQHMVPLFSNANSVRRPGSARPARNFPVPLLFPLLLTWHCRSASEQKKGALGFSVIFILQFSCFHFFCAALPLSPLSSFSLQTNAQKGRHVLWCPIRTANIHYKINTRLSQPIWNQTSPIFT